MNPKKIINAFIKLGEAIENLTQNQLSEYINQAKQENPWFIEEFINFAVEGIKGYLKESELNNWTSQYDLNCPKSKKVGVIAAGNIPMVGFHDVLCVLISGHELHIKLSSKDSFLIKEMLRLLVKIEPEFENRIFFRDNLKNVDALIATGSDASSRYFEYYFSSIPHVIRRNRTSVAVLDGTEGPNDFKQLNEDVFLYFGMGCRSVSKVFIPENFNIEPLINDLNGFDFVSEHHKYRNNYEYNKTLLLMRGENFYDNGTLLLKPSTDLFSSVSVLFYEEYKNQEDLTRKITSQAAKIQCVVSKVAFITKNIEFGNAQLPKLYNYADNIDTLKFLNTL